MTSAALRKGLVVPLLLFGLPTHILVVHAVVVFVPLAALGVVVIAVWPRARRRYGWLVLAVTVVATVSVPIATNAGEALEHALPRTAALETHTRLGDHADHRLGLGERARHPGDAPRGLAGAGR